ncbi:hypothetical protein T05_4193 [Trichinella murrelli]|uniref:Uncharacterized protein n=1 Tax=Trichinella murrelli TaxID=144512 RepID=A0A0V0U1R4_9BILA|nr:hypothetical protein T05_4193 [Trichinella murrelli]
MQNLPHSVGQTKRTISPPLGAGKSTKLPAHLRQVKQLSLTRLFSAESLGFPRSREEERALCLPKEQGRVCTLPCLREGSFTLQDGAHFWSLHPPPALNIQSPTPDMFAISQNSFMPDFICLFPRLTELGPTGNRIYLLSFLVLLRAVRDPFRVVRDLLALRITRGGWRDQKWAPSWSVKLPSLRQGRVQTLPCSLGRQSARSPSLERGKPRLSALKRRGWAR